MKKMTVALPSILAILAAVAALIAPSVREYISAHPDVATLLAAAAAIIGNFLPQPHKVQ